MSRDEVKRTPFGAILKDIREVHCEESQEEFAHRLHVSRSLIGSLETKGTPTSDFVKLLAEQFSAFAAKINEAAKDTYERIPPRSKGKDATLLTVIDRLIDTGQHIAAIERIRYELYRENDDSMVFELERRNGYISAVGGDYAGSHRAFLRAIELGEKESAISRHDMSLVWEDFIDILQKVDFRLAHSAIQDALRQYPTATAIWHRKGIIHFIEKEHASAYAALTIAMQHGKSHANILVTRGCVLAEWGRHEAAVRDLEQALKHCDGELVVEQAKAQAALAFSLFKTGYKDRALKESDIAEKISTLDPYVHYFMGILEAAIGSQMAQNSFEAALLIEDMWVPNTHNSHTLGLKRINQVERWLEDLSNNRPLRAPLDNRTDYRKAKLRLDSDNKKWHNASVD
jgi:tetratricopeptide (TPR) repeat protein